MAKEFLYPNAAGDETSIDWQTPSSTYHWDKVDEAVADNLTTCVWTPDAAYQRDLYNLPVSSGSGTINFIKIYFRCTGWNINCRAKPSLKSNATVTDGTEITPSIYTTWTTYSQQWNINPADAGAWEWADIDALQIGVSLKGTSGYAAACTQVFVEIDYTVGAAPQTISPSGIASAEAFGSPTFTGEDLPQTVSPSSIASEEAFGIPILSGANLPQTISPTGIASAEAFGSPVVSGSPYVFLTLSSLYSCYKDWTCEGDALPSHVLVYKNDVINNVWEQGIDEHSLRCLIGDFDPTADYTATYQRADYLMAWDAIATYGILTHSWTDKSIGTAGTLLTRGRLELTSAKTPPITYKIQAADLSIYDGFSFDALKLGSIVTVIDEELGIDVSVRVTRLIKPDLLAPLKMHLELSNKTKSLADSISDIYKQLV